MLLELGDDLVGLPQELGEGTFDDSHTMPRYLNYFRSTKCLCVQEVQRPGHRQSLHDRHDDTKAEQSDLVGQVLQRGRHALADRDVKGLESTRQRPAPGSGRDGPAEPVIPGTGCEHLAAGHSSGDVVGAVSLNTASSTWSSMTIKLVDYWTARSGSAPAISMRARS